MLYKKLTLKQIKKEKKKNKWSISLECLKKNESDDNEGH
jgi:hypothetical protein